MTHKPTASELWFFIFAVVGFVLTGGIALLSGLFSLLTIALDSQSLLPQTVWWSVTFSFLALAGIPAVVFGYRGLRGVQEVPRPISKAILLIPIIGFPLAIALGYVGFNIGLFPNVLGSAAQILGACGSSALAVLLIRKYSPALSNRRLWGQFTVGLWAVPFLAFLGEIILFLPMLVLFVLGALGSSEGRAFLDLLSDPTSSTAAVTEITEQLIAMPWVILLAFGFVSILVPLLEEALKTMVIWPLLRRGLSPTEAFFGGVIGGASYGLVEAILLSQQADEWLAIMAARTGATLMHSFTTGIAAWGLAEGFVRKRWNRMGVGYFIAVGFHGLWNAFAIGIAVLESSKDQGSVSNGFLALQALLPFAILGMIVIAILALPRIARRLSLQTDPILED